MFIQELLRFCVEDANISSRCFKPDAMVGRISWPRRLAQGSQRATARALKKSS